MIRQALRWSRNAAADPHSPYHGVGFELQQGRYFWYDQDIGFIKMSGVLCENFHLLDLFSNKLKW